jgi:cytochrome d ubiquinol oxidase subunit I
VVAGWVVTETGRQPWIVYNILRTADATSPVIGTAIAFTFALFVIVYAIVFSAGIYFINRLIAKGLQVAATPEGPPTMGSALGAGGRAGREALRGG